MLKKIIIIFMCFASILIGRSEPQNNFSEDHVKKIDLEINKAIKESKIPGAVLWIEKENNLYHQKYGKKCDVHIVMYTYCCLRRHCLWHG